MDIFICLTRERTEGWMLPVDRRVKIAQKWAKRDEKYYQADFFTIDS